MSKVVRLGEVPGQKGLKITDENIPTPTEGQVLVKLKTAGINRAELMFLHGQYLVEPQAGAPVGVEGAGVIEKLGNNVSGFSEGDEVCIRPFSQFGQFGVLGEYAIVPKEALIEKPSNISWKEASAVWMAYPTAYAGLVNAGGLKKDANQVVLISAASSSVGLPSIQMAKAHGATVIATSRNLDKEATLKEYGADYVVPTGQESWPELVMEITKGKGFDIAFDPIAGKFTEELANCAGAGATIVTYGVLDFNNPPLIPLFPMMLKGIKLTGIHAVFHLLDIPEKFVQAKEHILAGLESGIYKPRIDKEFSLESITEAYDYMESGKQQGKILININD